MKNEDVVAILGLLRMTLSRVRPDIPIAGSPERCLERTVVEDCDGRIWILERLDPRTVARKTEIASVDLEAVFIGLLLENREVLTKAWA